MKHIIFFCVEHPNSGIKTVGKLGGNMKQTEIPEALAATLIHLLPKEKISISDIEDILKETLSIFKSIPLDIPKPKK